MGSVETLRRRTPSLLGLLALAWLVALALPAVAAQPRPSVEIAGETGEQAAEPLAVEMSAGEGGAKAGELELPLLIRQPGRLAVTWVEMASGESFRLGVDQRSPAPLSGELPKAELAAGDVQVLRLTFAAPAPQPGSQDPPKLGGLLSVRSGDGMPLVREVSAADEQAAQTLTPTQEKVTISATRFLPLLTDPPTVEREVGMVVAGSSAAKAQSGSGAEADAEPVAESYVTLDDQGNGTVTVGAPSGDGDVKRSAVVLSGASGVGAGTTKVDLGGEGEEAKQLEVEVKVGDGLVGPLIAILLGLLLGRYLPAFVDLRRQSRMLRGELKAAVDGYGEALEQDSLVELGLAGVEDAVGPLDDWPPELRWWNPLSWQGREGLADRANESAAALYYRLNRVLRPSRLRGDAERAAELIDTIEGWVTVRAALVELAKATASELPEPAPVEDAHPLLQRPLNDSRELLGREQVVDTDLDAAKQIAQAVRWQAAALRLILSIYRLALSGPDLDEDAVLEALRAYLDAKPAQLRSRLEAEQMTEELRRIHFALERTRIPAEPELARAAVAELRALGIEGFLGNLPSQLLGGLLNAAEPSKARSAEQVMSGVRAGSLLLSGLAFLISALAVLLPLYADGPFGTLHDYLGVFVAGAAIQVVVNTAAPLAKPRSSKRPEEPAATETAPATA